MSKRVRTAISLSASLRHSLELAIETSGRTLSDEIEALLRLALDHASGDELLLLRIDSGLMGWLRAYAEPGPSLAGNLHNTAVFLMRSALIDDMKCEAFFVPTVNRLPSPTKEYVMETPKYREATR